MAIVQARMSSSRLPGKVLKPLAGRAVLEHVVRRLEHCRTLDEVVVATSDDASDDPIVSWCENYGVRFHRGSLDDVLGRYRDAAHHFGAEVVVRITADCPVIDPIVVDLVVDGFLGGDYDYFGLGGEFPNGLDCEVMTQSALERAADEAIRPSDREHVTPYFKRHPKLFAQGSVAPFDRLFHHRWTLDVEEDYQFLCRIFEHLYQEDRLFLTQDLLRLLDQQPELMTINAAIERGVGYQRSLAAELDAGWDPEN